MTGFNEVIQHIDCDLTKILKNLNNDISSTLEEIRLRSGKPLMISAEGKDFCIDSSGKAYKDDKDFKKGYIVNLENINNTFQKISNHSIYSIQEELKQGFITIKGGHRIGLIGKCIYKEDKLFSIKNISSINIRISREVIGASENLMKYLVRPPNNIYSTLLVSPPKCGKTTLLRDIIRNLSDGMENINMKGLKIGVVDERSEIAAMHNGQPQNDLGLRTDILDSCYKYDGMMILLRSMSPDVIATDEIGDAMDIKAMYQAVKSGVKIIATAHGEDLEDIKNKLSLGEIIENKVFERIVTLDNSRGVGTISDVIDGKTYKSIL